MWVFLISCQALDKALNLIRYVTAKMDIFFSTTQNPLLLTVKIPHEHKPSAKWKHQTSVGINKKSIIQHL